MIREGTCITDRTVPGESGWVSLCGCGKEWPLGKMIDVCVECVAARCNHPKAGVDFEQGRLV